MIGMWKPPVAPPGGVQFQRLVECLGGEIALFLVGVADSLLILFHLRGIVGLGKKILEIDRIWNTDRVQIFHGANHLALGESLVADDGDFADLHFGAFIDVEHYLE